MILPDYVISRLARDGMIEPFEPDMVQPASIDVRLATDAPWILGPGDTMLGSTFEKVRLPADICARVEGKSSWGRKYLLIHCTAGFIDPGFEGNVTLEFVNLGKQDIVMIPGMPIAQICFMQMTAPAAKPYQGKYQGSVGTVAAR